MNDQKNLILTVVISLMILIGWQMIFPPQLPEEGAVEKPLGDQPTLPVPSDEQVMQRIEKSLTVSDALEKTKSVRVRIENSELSGTIALKGARFDDLRLSTYNKTLNGNNPVDLLAPSGTDQAYFAEFGWISSDKMVTVPTHNSVWQADGDVLSASQPLTLSWTSPENVTFRMHISLDKHYLFDVKQSVENNSGQAVTLFPYGLVHRVRELGGSSYVILHEGALGSMHGVLEEFRYEDLLEERMVKFQDTKGWLGITDKYWLTALVPARGNVFDANYSYTLRNNRNHFQVDYLGEAIHVKAAESASFESHFFAGAKRLNLLENYSEELEAPLFDRTVDFGWLYFITKPLFQLLHFLAEFLGSFGLGILALTVIIKLILFPLANKSYVSMHHLKRLHPQLKDMKERYGHDKMRLNQEMMALYKREKVNPMAGCLPILIQIPVFFALYKVLFVTIEMRHAPFYGWIDDLSAVDPTNLFNLFGLIPWDPPSFLHLGLWPLIMGATMILQQRMQPAPADPVQARVMKMLPYIFVFIFASFPAGLVIYWAWNNILSVLQQWVITRKLPKV